MFSSCNFSEQQDNEGGHTPDLKFAELKGKVKSCTVFNNGKKTVTYEFDEAGKLKNLSDSLNESYFVQHDEKGRIVQTKAMAIDVIGQEKCFAGSTYEYDEADNMTKAYYEQTRLADIKEFTYKDGRMTEYSTYNTYDGVGPDKDVKVYKADYIATDDQGNWVKRELKSDKPVEEYLDSVIVQTREIVYF